MKRKWIYVNVVLIIIAAVVLFAFQKINKANKLTELPPIYLSYKTIQELPETRNFISQKLTTTTIEYNSDTTYTGPWLDRTSRNVILHNLVETNTDLGFAITYLMLDSIGNCIDTLHYNKGHLISFGNYLITPDYFYTWMKSRDKNSYQILELNDSLRKDSLAINQEFIKLYNSFENVYYFDWYELASKVQGISKVVFFNGNKGVALTGKNIINYGKKGYPKKCKSAFTILKNLASTYYIEKKNKHIYLDYFQRLKYHKGHAPQWGSTTGVSSPEYWDGMAYLNVILKGDTFKIAQAASEFTESTMGRYHLNELYYYSNTSIGFSIFRNDMFNFYIFKER